MPKTPSPFARAAYIDTGEKLSQLVETLKVESLIGIDTESNSLHAYRERVCLVQLSTRTADYLIDTLRVTAMSPLNTLFADPSIEKVFHAAEYDLMCLKRDFGFEIVNLFDTMIAARVCGYKQVGLSNLLAQHFGIEIDKIHQRDNWGARPLSNDSLLYAQMDSHYLPLLRDVLHAELIERGSLDEAMESFIELSTSVRAHDGRSFDPEGFWKIGQPQQLSMGEMAVLRELYLLREEIAEQCDVPPFKIFYNQLLVDIARRMPHTLNDLANVRGMTPSQTRRYGKRIIASVHRGRSTRLSNPPQHHPPPVEISDRYMALHAWRKEKALQRGVESDVIVSKQALWDLAYKAPTTLEALKSIHSLGSWRRQTYGQEIVDVIAEYDGKL